MSLHSKPVSPAILGHRAELPKVQATELLPQLAMLLEVSFIHLVSYLLIHSFYTCLLDSCVDGDAEIQSPASSCRSA